MQFHNIQIKNEKIQETKGSGLIKTEDEKAVPFEPTYIGEEKNKNVRTRIEAPHEAGLKLRADDRKLAAFKEEAERLFSSYEKNKESLTVDILKGLEEEGVNPGRSETTLVERSVKHILENREKKKESLRNQVEELSRERKEIEKIAVSLSVDRKDEVIQRLEKSGLPLTKANMEKLSSGMEMADRAIDKLDESAMYHVIKTESPETIENLLRMEELPSLDFTPQMEEKNDIWEGMKEKAAELLFNRGVKKGEGSEKAAKWLFQRELPVTSENIARFESLQNLKEEARNPQKREEIYESVAEKMAEGEAPLSAEIGSEKIFLARQKIYYFKTVIETKALYEEVTARRQIEEIRLKLTEEVAVKMLKKGIKIDVTDLKGLVDNLKKEEEAYLTGLTEEGELENHSLDGENKGQSQVELFRETLAIRSRYFRTEEEGGYHYEALSFAFKSTETLSLRTYHKAGLAYEAGATEIRRDLGDSMKKAFSDVDGFLRRNGFMETDENRRAVKLLAYQNAEINESSLMKMKAVSLLVEEVFTEMKPATVANLIKSGENPLDLSMEELYKKLKKINDEIKPEEEKFSTYLFKLEKQGRMNKEEREAYIGIYRLLSQIEKGDGAAIGGVSLADKAMTLRNLLEMVRTKKLGHFDKKIDDGIYEASDLLAAQKIDTQIETAFASLEARRWMREAAKKDEEAFREEERLIKERQTLLSDVEKLLEAGEKATFSTVVAQMEIRGGRKNLRHFLSKMDEDERGREAEETLDILEELSDENRRKLKEWNEKLIARVDEGLKEAETYEEAKNLIGLKQTLALSIRRAEVETYDIPFIDEEGRAVDFQLTVRRAKQGEARGKIEIRLFMEETEIGGSFRLSGDRLSAMFFAEDRDNMNRLIREKEAFSLLLQDLGLVEGEITYHLGKLPTVFLDSDDIYSGKTESVKLYELAKKVSTHFLKGVGMI